MSEPTVNGTPPIVVHDDDDGPAHRARVMAVSSRVTAVRHFRLAFESELLAGTRPDEAIAGAAELMGQMVAEIAAKIQNRGMALAVAQRIPAGATAAASLWLHQAFHEPQRWAERPGAPAGNLRLERAHSAAIGQIETSEPQTATSARALVDDAIENLVRAVVLLEHERGEPVDSAAISVEVRAQLIAGRTRQAAPPAVVDGSAESDVSPPPTP